MLEIGRAVFAGRRADGDEYDVRGADRFLHIGREGEPPCGEILFHQRIQTGLEDRQLSPLEPLDLLGDDVGAQHIVSGFGQTGTHDQSDVAGADDRDIHR